MNHQGFLGSLSKETRKNLTQRLAHNEQRRDLPRSHWLQGTEKKETGSRTLCANVYFSNSPGGEQGVQAAVAAL